MSKLFYPDFFNDVFGPIMQPGSSSSFGGTSRVGRIARATLKSEPKAAKSESSIRPEPSAPFRRG
jgi:L-serine dehydratase